MENQLLSFLQMHIDLGKKEIDISAELFRTVKELITSRKFDKVRNLIIFKIVN